MEGDVVEAWFEQRGRRLDLGDAEAHGEARVDVDDERLGLPVGLVGDVAKTFPRSQIKQFFLAKWLANELRMKRRMAPETRLRWVGRRATSLVSSTLCAVPLKVVPRMPACSPRGK